MEFQGFSPNQVSKQAATLQLGVWAGAAETAQQVKFAALAEDWGSIPGTHMVAYNHPFTAFSEFI